MNAALLRLLTGGDFLPGPQLAQQAGVSRAAVWKQVQGWRQRGVPIEAVRGKGYRIPGGLELLEAARIREAITPGSRRLLPELEVHAMLDSTNVRCWQRAADVRRLVCFAEFQSQGRGRRGRRWVSPFGGGIYLSLLWSFEGGAAALEALALAVGVSVVETLERFTKPGLALKWPNDILWRERKLGGILLEMEGDPAGSCRAVAGIGINGALPPGVVIDQDWTDLAAAADKPLSRNTLSAALLDGLLPLLADYEKTGFAPWRERWQRQDGFCGRAVVLKSGDTAVRGTAAGIDESGALCLRTSTGVRRFSGGELQLRLDR